MKCVHHAKSGIGFEYQHFRGENTTGGTKNSVQIHFCFDSHLKTYIPKGEREDTEKKSC